MRFLGRVAIVLVGASAIAFGVRGCRTDSQLLPASALPEKEGKAASTPVDPAYLSLLEGVASQWERQGAPSVPPQLQLRDNKLEINSKPVEAR